MTAPASARTPRSSEPFARVDRAASGLAAPLAIALTLAGVMPAAAATSAPATRAAAPAGPTATVAPAEIVAAKRALADAVATGTLQDVLEARRRFAALTTIEPKNPLLHYWVAVADWRAEPRLSSDALASRMCEDGLTEADRALAHAPEDPEALAIKASLLGMSFRFHPGSAMTLGPQIEDATQAALAAGPTNPRVLLLAGLNTLNKPTFVGGGAEPALAQLEKSEHLFEAATPADSTAPDWGHEDAYLWAGQALMRLGKPAEAKSAYAKVLELNPRHAWVLRQLMPEAEKALAAPAPAAAPAAK